MRYIYCLHLKSFDGKQFVICDYNVSKTRLFNVFDFYSKYYKIEQFLVEPNIQNPRPVGDETDKYVE